MALMGWMSALEPGHIPSTVLSEEDSDLDETALLQDQARPHGAALKIAAIVPAVLGVVILVALALRNSASGSPPLANLRHTIQASSAPVQVNGQPAAWASNISKSLKPVENMNDNNPCENGELFENLCYQKCANLTNGMEPFRQSAFTCCPSASPCADIANIIPCTGYDVGTDGNCPRSPGACLTNEEYFLGVCYKKCDTLTNHVYPYRTAAATCCKSKDIIDCFDIINNAQTDAAYNVGGGAGDGDKSTPGNFHTPMPSLTEN